MRVGRFRMWKSFGNICGSSSRSTWCRARSCAGQLPLTPNGKVDRQRLPAPGAEAYEQVEYEAPQGEIEGGLAQIWQQLLRVERVGRQDNFFKLGGHSLLALQVVSRVGEVLGREITCMACSNVRN